MSSWFTRKLARRIGREGCLGRLQAYGARQHRAAKKPDRARQKSAARQRLQDEHLRIGCERIRELLPIVDRLFSYEDVHVPPEPSRLVDDVGGESLVTSL